MIQKTDNKVIRVAMIGPESSGKSTLCRQLSDYYKTSFVPEYAREYLASLKRPYTKDDVLQIYATQFELEQNMLHGANHFLFTDTEFINGKVWIEEKFNEKTEWFEEMTRKHPYDVYLLTRPDVEWEFDPLRENQGRGEYFFNKYKTELLNAKLKWVEVFGTGRMRLSTAIDGLSRMTNLK